MSLIVNYVKRALSGTWDLRNCKMVIVVRSDVPMTKGKTATQCAHAALECYRQTSGSREFQRIAQSWLLDGQPKIVLKIPNEKELLNLAYSAKQAGLITAVIRDAGRTQLKAGTISALGIGPGPKEAIDNLTGNLKLL